MEPRKCLGLFALTILAMVFGVASAQPPTALPPDAGDVQLEAGDQIKMEVFNRPELATTTYVGNDGSIRVPLAGSVPVAGLSPTAAAERVEAAYKSGQYLVNPHVTLTVTVSQSRVSVLGEVKTPGRYSIEPSTTVLDILALAGGRTDKGSDLIYLLRQDAGGAISRYPINLQGLANQAEDVPDAVMFRLHNGDRLYIPQASQYFLVGEVRTPATYRLENGITVQRAIALAGGITDKGSMHRIEIKRKKPNGDYAVLSGKPNDPIQADDMITVKERIF